MDIKKRKCRDCIHWKIDGWWMNVGYCDISGFAVDKDEGICISFLDRKQKKK